MIGRVGWGGVQMGSPDLVGTHGEVNTFESWMEVLVHSCGNHYQPLGGTI